MMTKRVLQAMTFALLTAPITGNGADLLEIYRMAQASDAQYAAARASWSACA